MSQTRSRPYVLAAWRAWSANYIIVEKSLFWPGVFGLTPRLTGKCRVDTATWGWAEISISEN